MKVTGKLIGWTPSQPTLSPRTEVPVEGAGKRPGEGRRATEEEDESNHFEALEKGCPEEGSEQAPRNKVKEVTESPDHPPTMRERVVCLLIDRNSTLWTENRELKSSAGPKAMATVERRATELSAELERVKATLKESEQRRKDHELATNSAHSELKDLREL
ncbi:hypothetical protein BHM03_00060721 [Ensete ventricosum]|nr:hypothetical protein BHM03_00060721 [Ensete ventricosum]